VIGTVFLWGRVIECTRGWRTSRAYRKAICVPATCVSHRLKAEQVALALIDYGVPVQLLEADCCGPDEVVAAIGHQAPAGEADA
jgi:hypothetical protein